MSDGKKNLDNNEVDYKKKITARHKRNKIFGIILLVCLSSVIIGMTLGIGFGFASRLFDKFMQGTTKNNFVFDESQIKDELNQNTTPNNIFSSESENLQDIIENVSKSVVAINTVTESGLSLSLLESSHILMTLLTMVSLSGSVYSVGR